MTCCVDPVKRHPLVLVCLLFCAAGLGAQSTEDIARRTLESGRSFLRAHNFKEAVNDFESVLQRYPSTSVADDALLELALYQLEIVRDPAAADARAKELLKTYPTSDSAPMALVVEGRVALATGRGPEAINAALASFDRVPRLFPGTEAVPASMYYSGEAARVGGQRDDAIQRFNQLSTQFPNSPWTAQALLGSARSLVRAGQAARAMDQLQRIRNRFPNSTAANTALDWNTVLYRLYLRSPAQPAFVFTGRNIPPAPGKLKDVADIAVDSDNTLLVAVKSGILGYPTKGNPTSPMSSPEPRRLLFDRFGKVMTVHEGGVRAEGRTPVVLNLPAVQGKNRQLKAEDAVMTATGDYLLADRDEKTIFRFGNDTRYLGEFAKMIEVRRLAIDDLDTVAVLNDNSKSITLLSREGKVVKQIQERASNYQLHSPADLTFDAFGHLYVLDRTAVLVFSPDGSRLVTTFSIPEKSAGAIGNAEAMALDGAGRLFVFDSRTDSVKTYR